MLPIAIHWQMWYNNYNEREIKAPKRKELIKNEKNYCNI